MEITYSTPVDVAPGIRRLTCNNPSPLTGPGTNSYLLGTSDTIVIDPGPADPGHIAALTSAAPDIRLILVTHSHLDHSPGATLLSRATGAPICAFGPTGAGTSTMMQGLPDLGGGEGSDHGFAPDRLLQDEETIPWGDTTITCHHTPGHFGNHMTFEVDGICFSGDLVLGWATTLISPPDGDLTDFMASCRALLDRAPHLLLPGHGEAVTTPKDRIEWLISHRQSREAQIRAALDKGPGTPAQIAARVYTDVGAHLLPAATRNVLAHLIDLKQQSLVAHDGPLSPDSRFHAI